jgi:hypothetical protein
MLGKNKKEMRKLCGIFNIGVRHGGPVRKIKSNK